MQCRSARLVLLVLLAAAPAAAHNIPVLPSTCALDPLEVTLPDRGLGTMADPPAPGDTVRTIYDLQEWMGQFSGDAPAPRSFVLGGVGGSISFPKFFVSDLLSTGHLVGDLVLLAVPVTVALGDASATMPVRFSTGLVGLPGLVVAGAPLDIEGRFTAVGIVPDAGLGPPLGGTPLVLRVSCHANPRPDTDQFRVATQSVLVSGAARKGGTLEARVIFAPGIGLVPDFAGAPALFEATAGGTRLAAGYLPSLVQRGRRLFVGRSDDRTVSIGVRYFRRRFGVDNYVLAVKLRGAMLPSPSGRRVPVAITYEVGGLLSRLSATFRANGAGTRLTFR